MWLSAQHTARPAGSPRHDGAFLYHAAQSVMEDSDRGVQCVAQRARLDAAQSVMGKLDPLTEWVSALNVSQSAGDDAQRWSMSAHHDERRDPSAQFVEPSEQRTAPHSQPDGPGSPLWTTMKVRQVSWDGLKSALLQAGARFVSVCVVLRDSPRFPSELPKA